MAVSSVRAGSVDVENYHIFILDAPFAASSGPWRRPGINGLPDERLLVAGELNFHAPNVGVLMVCVDNRQAAHFFFGAPLT
jgi:hypothetical protein